MINALRGLDPRTYARLFADPAGMRSEQVEVRIAGRNADETVLATLVDPGSDNASARQTGSQAGRDSSSSSSGFAGDRPTLRLLTGGRSSVGALNSDNGAVRAAARSYSSVMDLLDETAIRPGMLFDVAA